MENHKFRVVPISLVFTLCLTLVLSLSLTSAMPTPTITDTSKWELTTSTLKDFKLSADLTSKTGEICITPIDKLSVAKPVCYIPKDETYIKIQTEDKKEFIELNLKEETEYEYPTASFDYKGFEIDFYCNRVKLDFPTTSIISNEPIGTGVKWSLKVPENYSCIGEFTAQHNVLERVIPHFSNQFITEYEKYYIDYTDFDSSPFKMICHKFYSSKKYLVMNQVKMNI